jgi:pyridoxine 5-phosphate synthase
MALSPELIEIATKVKPNQITIVPERMEELTTEGALDIKKNVLQVRDTVKLLHDQTISVSLFIDPDKETIELSKECEADFVEINTAAYCSAVQKTEIDKEIERVYSAANHAVKAAIKVSAGHGLNYENIAPVLKARALEQVTIGHSIIARSVFVGLPKAVKEMLDILD